MKNFLFLLVLINIFACSQQECYECKDYQTTFEAVDEFKENYYFTTPNFAVAGQDIIPLLVVYRLDNSPFTLVNPILTLKGENSEVFFEGDATSLISIGNTYEIPPSLLFSDSELQSGQISFNLSFKESISNMSFSMEGSFLFVSCETYLNSEIKNREDCRDNLNIGDVFGYNYGC